MLEVARLEVRYGAAPALWDVSLTVAEAELVGLAPRAALEGFPADVALRGFSPERHLVEEALEAVV